MQRRGHYLLTAVVGRCEEINPREKPQNGTQENPEKPNRRRKGESPRVP